MLIKKDELASRIGDDFSRISRRGFIRSGLWMSVGVATSAIAGLAYLRRSPRDAISAPEGLRVLSASQYQLFQRLGEICFAVNDSILQPVSNVPIGLQADSLIAGIRVDIRKQLLIGLDLLDNAAVLASGQWSRLVDMSDGEARAYLDNWTNSSVPTFRAIANAAMRLTKSAYWESPSTWAAINYPGPVTGPRGIERLGNAPRPAATPRLQPVNVDSAAKGVA